MRALLCAAVLALGTSAVPARAQDSDHWDARLTAVTGEVVVYPAGGGDEVSGEAGMPLEEGDRVATSADSTAEVSLDGSSLITLSANSDFTLENTQKSASIFSLSLGSILAKIQKLGSESLSVRTPTSVAAVRGTEFGVNVEADQSHVGVFDEGRVEVSGQSGGMTVLTPNQETSVSRGQAPLRAFALRRFAGRRAMMRARIRRLAMIRRSWRPMALAQRREFRAKALLRLRQRRLKRLQKRELQRHFLENRERRRARGQRQPRRRRDPKPRLRAQKRRRRNP